ncbi:MAG: hypothetical protein U0Q18_15665 [Bryobacteraceae bacterium]
MPFPYADIPSLVTWQSDSTEYFPSRPTDRVLKAVDDLVAAYNDLNAGGSGPEILFYLRSALVFWAKKVNVVPKNTPPDGVRPLNALPRTAVFSGSDQGNRAIAELLAIVTKKLVEHHSLNSPDALDGALFNTYSKPNEDEANDTKYLKRCREQGLSYVYLEEDGLRRKYKLRFRDGIAWRWYDRTSEYAHFDTTDNTESQMRDKMTHFVMDRRGRLYAGFDLSVKWFKHSSLIGGQGTLAAGRLGAQDGRITRIENDSGHYEPGHQQMRNLLERLHLYGADLSHAVILRHMDKHEFSAAEVRASRGQWPDGQYGQF